MALTLAWVVVNCLVFRAFPLFNVRAFLDAERKSLVCGFVRDALVAFAGPFI